MARTRLAEQLGAAASVARESFARGVEVDQVLEERRTTRCELLRDAGALALGVGALGRFASTAKAAQPARVVVVGAGLAGLTAAHRLRQAGCVAAVHEGSDRVGGRCWTIRGEFADGQIGEHGGELIDQGHTELRQLAQELGLELDNLVQGEQNGSDPAYFFDGAPYPVRQATLDLRDIWSKLHGDLSAASYPTLYNSSTARGRVLDQMSIVDWINESVPGGINSRLGQLLDVAYNIEYGAESSQQSSLNLVYLLGYQGPGNFRIFGKSNEKYHVRGGNDQVATRLAGALGGQITLGSELVAIRLNADGTYALSFRQGGPTRTVIADRVVLAVPFSILRSSVDISRAGFSPLKRTAISELGMGTNSKLHVQFRRPALGVAGLLGRDVLGSRLPEHVGGDPDAVRQLGNPRRLHGRDRRRELRIGHSAAARRAVPGPDRARAARCQRRLERPCHARLLAREQVVARFVLLLEGRAVHAVCRDRARTREELLLLRRAHLD